MKYNSIRIIKIVILLFIIPLLILGCTPSVNDIIVSELPPSPTVSNNSPLPVEIVDIDTLNIFYLAWDAAKYENLPNWQEYINEKLGINLMVNYSAFYASTLLEREFDGIVYLNYQKGFPYEFNTTVYEYSYDDIAYDLSKYYEKYGWDQFIDPEYLSALTVDGKIYAVPTAVNKYIVPRYYNKETLSELGLNVPKTVNEFYEYLVMAKVLYKDDENYIPCVITNHRFASSISDIARAYGVYFNNYFNSSVSFNPQTDSIEDAIFSDDINDLLQFIRHLQKEGLLATYSLSNNMNPFNGEKLDTYITDLDQVSKNFASEYNFVYSNNIDGFEGYLNADKNYESINGYYLTGSNDKNVCEIRSDMGFYVFPKSIDNIDGTIKAFNSQFTNPDNYMDFKYGIMGEDYNIVNDKIVKMNLRPSIDGANLELKLITDAYKTDSSYVPESLEFIERLENNISYERNVFNHMSTYSQLSLNNTFNFNRNEEVEAIFNPDIPLEDAIEYYKNLVRRSGQVEVIYELNKQMGKTTKFGY